MKKFLILLLLCCSAATITVAQWVNVPSGTFLDLNDIWFSDADNGWIAADSSTLLRTTDAGATWSEVHLPIAFTPKLVAIEFMDADTGYAIPEFGAAWVTHDAGASWAESPEFGGDACYGTQMSFGSDAEYFLQRGCFGGNGFYTRTDTGMAYSLMGFPVGFEMTDYLRDIEWVDANHAVAMGDNNFCVSTTNRGLTWEVSTSRDTFVDWKAITFTSPTDGWAVNGDLFEPLYHSTDGGVTWTPAFWMATFAYPEHRSVGASNGHVFAGGDIDWSSGGIISDLRVADSAFFYEIVQHPVNGFGFPSADVGFAVGDSGMILRLDSIMLSRPDLADPADDALLVFPNPANEQVTVRWISAGNHESLVTLRDLSGREVMRQQWRGAQDLRMDVGSLPAGLYLLECVTAQGMLVRKVTVH